MGTQGPRPYSRLCVRRIIVDVTTSEIGNEPKCTSHKVTTVTDKIVYADVNQTSASKRTVHERFWENYRLYQPTTASTMKLLITPTR